MAVARTQGQEHGQCGECREVRMVLKGSASWQMRSPNAWLSVSLERGWGARASAKLTQGHISKVLNTIPKIWAVSCVRVCVHV